MGYFMKELKSLAGYGLAHAVVDAVCAGVLFNFLFLGRGNLINLILLYGVLAFGLQPLFGLLVDKLKAPKGFSILGILLVGLSTIIFSSPQIAVIFAGLGNAIFHVGGGTVSLNITPKKASAPGIFVAPGAIGLAFGTVMGKLGFFVWWHFLLAILAAGLVILLIKIPKIDYVKRKSRLSYFELVLLLFLLSILIRSFIGTILVFPWKANLILLIILTVGVFIGKALGGIIADKFGWIKTAVASLLISAPLLAFGSLNPALAIVGIFFFNMTMPITLVAISNLLPGRPGFAFGLTCLALIFGTILVYMGLGSLFGNWPIFLTIVVSMIALYIGLRRSKTP